MKVIGRAALFSGLWLCRLAAASDPNAADILQSSDHARGGGLPGVSWRVSVEATERGKTQSNVLSVKADNENSLVEYLSPARVNGQKLLMARKNMWFSQPGVPRPVPISPRQKLSGQAAYGDIAATNYAADYTAAFEREEPCGAEQCAVLRLSAAGKGVTYDRIVYWISSKRRVGVKAEFYTVSGKLFKTATFEYDNRIPFGGKQIPFVSRMVITDAVNQGDSTTLQYSEIKAAKISAAEFNVDLLAR